MMNQYIKCGGLEEGQRRRDVDLVKLEREGEEGDGDVGSVQMKLRRLLFDTVTTSFRCEREMKGRRWRNKEKDQRTATSEPAAWKCLAWVLTSGALKEENEGAKIFVCTDLQ